ncbi:hypothetical protein NQ318_008877 [Aromia moschata]|uniref:Uncharacterized protein n=1 Tax=Aromia moschata TaxID=1265417 RepID=A0AAV8ZAD3_9CUCU|nr:hypothetical protein NQ318_008877 [Aromia moschata]
MDRHSLLAVPLFAKPVSISGAKCLKHLKFVSEYLLLTCQKFDISEKLALLALMLLAGRCELVATNLNSTVSGDTFPTLNSLDKPVDHLV